MYSPQIEVIKRLHEFDKNLNIEWVEGSNSFYISQTIKWADIVDEDILLCKCRNSSYGVFKIEQAKYFDRRWYDALVASRNSVRKSISEMRDLRRKIYNQKIKQAEDAAQEWAEEEGWYAFKKEMSQYNLSTVRAEDPGRVTKMLEDKLGRKLN